MPAGDVLLSRLITTIIVSMGSAKSELREHRADLGETRQAAQELGGSYQQMAESVSRAYQETGQAASVASRETGQAFHAAEQGMESFSSHAVQLRAEIIRLNENYRGLQQRLRDLRKAEEDVANIGAGTFSADIEKVEQDMGRIRQQVSAYNREIGQLERGSEAAGTAQLAFSESVQGAGAGLNAFGERAVQVRGHIRELRTELSTLNTQYAQMTAAQARGGQDIGPALQEQSLRIGEAERNLRAYQMELRNLEQAEMGAVRETAGMGEATRAATSGLSALEQKSVQLRQRAGELGSEIKNLKQHIGELEAAGRTGVSIPGGGGGDTGAARAELANLERQLAGTRREIAEVEKSARSAGDGFGSGAVGIGRFYTALIAVQTGIQTVQGLASAYADMNTNLVKTEALTSTTHQEIEQLTPSIRKLSVDTGVDLKELTQGFYSLQSVTKDSAGSFQLLQIAAQASQAGFGETKDVINLLTTAQHDYGLTTQETIALMNPLTIAIRDGRGEAVDYTKAMGGILPLAERLGITFPEVAATLATLSLAESDTAKNATGLRQTLSELFQIRPGTDADKALRSLGLSAKELRQEVDERGLIAALRDLDRRTQGNQETLQRIFPDIRAFTSVLKLTAEQAAGYDATLAEATTTTTAFGSAVDIGSTSAANAGKRMDAAFANLGTTMAEKVAPYVLPLANELATRLTPSTEASGQKADEAAGKWERYGAAVKFVFDAIGGGADLAFGGIGNQIDSAGKGFEKFIEGATGAKKAYDDYQKSRQVQADFNLRNESGIQGPILNEPNPYSNPLNRQDIDLAEGAQRAAQAAREAADTQAQAIQEGGDRVQAALEAATDYSRQLALIGTQGRALDKALEDFVVKPFADGGQKALEAAGDARAQLEEAWRRALPSSIAEPQIARLRELFTQFDQTMGEEQKQIIANQIHEALVAFGSDQVARESKKHDDEIAAQKRADDRRRAAEDARIAREAREQLIQGLTEGLESRRFAIQEAYGKVGDAAVSGMVSALAGARSGRTTEPIIQAQARLAMQLKEAGVVDWQAAAEAVGQAYLGALAGTISGGQAAQVLESALAEIPKLTTETFSRGLDRQFLLSLGGDAGRHLSEGIAKGMGEGGQKNIEEVQKAAISIMRETEKINDPELAEQRAREFWDMMQAAIADGSEGALDELANFEARWNQQIQVDVAMVNAAEKIATAQAERERARTDAQKEASRQIGEIVKSVGEETGAEGLIRFRENLKTTLGETSGLFQRVNEEIEKQYTALSDPVGYRKAREIFQRAMDQRLRDFQEEQYKEQTAFQETEEQKRRELTHSREMEDVERRHSRENAQIALGISREDQDSARRRTREDAETSRQLTRELAEAQKRGATPQELGDIRQRAGEQAVERDRQRRFEEEDRGISRARAAEDVGIRRGQETADRQLARSREEQDVENSKQLRDRQHAFELGQAQKLRDEQLKIAADTQSFEDRMSASRAAHQLRNIAAEQATREAAADTTLSDIETKENTHLQNLITKVYNPGWSQVYDGWHANFYERADHDLDELIAKAAARNLAETAGAQAGSIGAAQSAKTAVMQWALPPLQGPPAPQEVRVVGIDEQPLSNLADAANDRPIMMDGSDVEDIQSKIRRGKFRARSLA